MAAWHARPAPHAASGCCSRHAEAAGADSGAAATAHGLVAFCDTRIIFCQPPGETDRTATELALTDPERAALATLCKGEALWKIGTTTRRIHTDLGGIEPTPSTPTTVFLLCGR